MLSFISESLRALFVHFSGLYSCDESKEIFFEVTTSLSALKSHEKVKRLVEYISRKCMFRDEVSSSVSDDCLGEKEKEARQLQKVVTSSSSRVLTPKMTLSVHCVVSMMESGESGVKS